MDYPTIDEVREDRERLRKAIDALEIKYEKLQYDYTEACHRISEASSETLRIQLAKQVELRERLLASNAYAVKLADGAHRVLAALDDLLTVIQNRELDKGDEPLNIEEAQAAYEALDAALAKNPVAPSALADSAPVNATAADTAPESPSPDRTQAGVAGPDVELNERSPSGLKSCARCGAMPVEPHLLRITCSGCGASTANFTGRLGEYQREEIAVRSAWNRGDFVNDALTVSCFEAAREVLRAYDDRFDSEVEHQLHVALEALRAALCQPCAPALSTVCADKVVNDDAITEKFTTMSAGENGWTEWTHPLPGYLMKCCDCGVVHELDTRIVRDKAAQADGSWDAATVTDPELEVVFRMRRQVTRYPGCPMTEPGAHCSLCEASCEMPSGGAMRPDVTRTVQQQEKP